MSKAETDFPDVEASKGSKAEPDTNNGKKLPARVRRLVPVIAAGTLTFLWSVAVAAYLLPLQNIGGLFGSAPAIAGLVAGYATPVIIFWLVALAFQRTDPLLEHRLAVAQNLHKAIAPVDVAEQRMAQLSKNLQKELQNIDAVADLAADRIKNLEDRFQEQINNLFSAAADTEARTTSIRDILERERGAIGDTTKDIEARFKALEEMVERISNQLEGTGRTVEYTADQARARIDVSFDTLGKATSEFESRMEAASTNVTSRAGEVKEISENVELRLHTATESALAGMERFRHDVEGLEGRSAELSEHMKTQGTVLHDLAELAASESAKIEESLRTHVGEVRTAASEALEKTSEVSDLFSERAQAMSERVIETVDKAKLLLDEAGSTLESHCEHALAASNEVNKQLLETTTQTGDAVIQHAETADQMLMEGLERAKNATTQVNEQLLEISGRTNAEIESHAEQTDLLLKDGLERAKSALEETMSNISEHSDEAVRRAEDAANRTLNHIRQLRAGVEEQIEELARTGEKAEASLSATVDSITEKSDELAAQSNETNEELSAVREEMSLQSDVIAEVLNETRAKLARLENDLTEQREVLNAASGDAADRVIEAAERFADHSRTLQNTADDIEDSLNEKSGDLVQLITDVGETGSSTEEKIQSAASTLDKKATELRGELADTSTAMGNAAEAFADERGRIRTETESVITELNRASDKMGAEVTNFTESSVEAANRLDAASQSLMDQTQRAQTDVRKSVDETGVELAATMDEISNTANERITFLQEEMQSTLARVLDDYQETADQAEKESALLAMRLGTEADKITHQAEQFIDKTAEIEKRIASASKDDFARTSKLLMESLQSTSIDINKALSDDLPDEVWAGYLAGDKSVFMRRTLKIGDRKTRKAIGDKFKNEADFRESVARYCRDFEGMMERAMMGDKGGAMSVTLISSDMGKLYILLAQSLKKFN